MRIAIAVHASHHSSEAARSALRFAKAAAAQNHSIHRVFFYHDAVLLARSSTKPDKAAQALQRDWLAFAERSGTELAVCVGAAERRALGADDMATAGFELVGLGQLIEAAISADRLVTFSA